MLLAVVVLTLRRRKSLEICKGFDRENDSGCKVSHRTIFDGQIPYKSLNFTLS